MTPGRVGESTRFRRPCSCREEREPSRCRLDRPSIPGSSQASRARRSWPIYPSNCKSKRIGQSAYAANNKRPPLEAWPGREDAGGPTLPPRSTTRLVERRAVEEIPRLDVKSGPERCRQAALTLFAVVAAEVFAARKV